MTAGNTSRKRRFALWFAVGVCGAACLLPLTRAVAQPSAATPFANAAPVDTPLFVTIRNLRDVDRAMRRSHAWDLLPLLEGRTSNDTAPFDLRKSVTRFLGTQASSGADEWFTAEMAIVARSWSQLGRAVWLVQVPDGADADQWFPVDQRIQRTRIAQGQRFITRGGRTVCLRGPTLAIARHNADQTLVTDTIERLAGVGGDALSASPEYTELMGELSPGYLAAVYLTGAAAPSAADPGMSRLLPPFEQAAIGLYEDRGTLELMIRARQKSPHARPALSASAVECLRRLPRATLLAMATTITTRPDDHVPTPSPGPSGIGSSLALMRNLLASAQKETRLFPEPGPQVVLAWGQNRTSGDAVPQVAALIECTDAHAVRNRAQKMAETILRVVGAVDTTATNETQILQHTNHLGTEITYVSIGESATKSQWPMVRMLDGVEPSFAVIDDWFVCALSTDHIRRIIDARHGMTHTLGAIEEVRVLSAAKGEVESLLIAQPALASRVLYRWYAANKRGSAPLLDAALWSEPAGLGLFADGPIGIGMKLPESPGAVLVVRVDDDSAADGVLRVDDRIIGVDGQWLDIHAPNADLRRRLMATPTRPTRTLRILRDAMVMEVVLQKPFARPGRSGAAMTPADAILEIASMGRGLRFASFAVDHNPNAAYAANLSLRFGRPKPRSAGGSKR